MDVELQKWGNNLGLQIPPQIAKKFGVDENSVVEIVESNNHLIITKKGEDVPTLKELLSSIPSDYEYPEDVEDFVETTPVGREII